MKPIVKEILIAAFMGLIVPSLMLSIAVKFQEQTPQPEPSVPQETVTPTQPRSNIKMHLTMPDGSLQTMDMDDYLLGVVLAEMPADFETEALKAQSVVARTYTLKAASTGGKHTEGSVCTDSSCCQAYIAEGDYLSGGGTAEAVGKVRSAVAATSGKVLTYNGELIEATYFSCSGGSTEDAVAVWGTDFPYLRAVESPGEEEAAHYTDTVTFTADEFSAALGQTLSGSPAGWLSFTTYTAGGGVNTMVIGGKEYKGTELRSLLGLRSTAFTMTAEENTITVTTKGFGHRVGMSQYGADAMAVTGSTYDQILAYYYQGTVLETYEN